MAREYDKMDRPELIDHMKRLRREEADILAEIDRMKESALRGITAELSTIRCYLQFSVMQEAGKIKAGDTK